MGRHQRTGAVNQPQSAQQDATCFDNREEVSIKAFNELFSDFPRDFTRSCAMLLKSQGKAISAKTLLEVCSERFDSDQNLDPLTVPRHSESPRDGQHEYRSLLSTASRSSSYSSQDLSVSEPRDEKFYSLPADYQRESPLSVTFSDTTSTDHGGGPEFYVTAGLPAMDIITDGAGVEDDEGEDCVDGPCRNTDDFCNISAGLPAMDIVTDGADVLSSPLYSNFEDDEEGEDCVDGPLGNMAAHASESRHSFSVGAPSRQNSAFNVTPVATGLRGQTMRDIDTPRQNHAGMDSLAVVKREREIRENYRLCTLCKINPRDVTFLPCGHFTTCSDCAEPIYVCPSCHKDIQGTVKTTLTPFPVGS